MVFFHGHLVHVYVSKMHKKLFFVLSQTYNISAQHVLWYN